METTFETQIMHPTLPGSQTGDYGNYIHETPVEFRVATAAYRGEAVFADEIERIFSRTWIYLCHESELQSPGDFKSTLLGRQPVIVSRDSTGKLTAVLNACPHRGATVCRAERGNTRALVCPYHGWSFRPSGELVGIPGSDRYAPGFDKSTKRLVSIAKVESYQGLVFGSLNADVESLSDFLGPAKQHIDRWAHRCANGRYRVANAHKYAFSGNWKFQAENIYDGYHPGFVHRSAFNTIKKFSGSFENRYYGAVRPGGFTRGYVEGHGTLEAGVPLESAGVPDDVKVRYEAALAELHGRDEADEILKNCQFLIFPNLAIFDYNIRVIQPITHDRTEVYSYPVLIDGVDEAISENRMLDAQTRVGSAGILSTDDIDVFAGGQSALNATGLGWVTLSRGLSLESISDDGTRVGEYSDETPQRAFWRKWRAEMTANNCVGAKVTPLRSCQ
jgi:benzoate/toluate 1,2-dioxygenase alpha subunit